MGVSVSKKKVPKGNEWELNVASLHDGAINCMTASADGTILATGSDDSTARVWSTTSDVCECLGVFTGHQKYITSILLIGAHLITGSADKTIKRWAMSTCECLHTYEGHTAMINSLVSDGELLFSSSYDRTIRCWTLKIQPNSDPCVRVFKGHSLAVFPLAFHRCQPDKIGSTTLMQLEKQQVGREFFNEVKEDLVISGSIDMTCRSWSLARGCCKHTFVGHTSGIQCIAVNVDGTIVYTGSMDTTARSWSLETGDPLKTFTGHKGPIICMQILPKVLYTGSADKTTKAWLIEFAENSRTYRGHKNSVTCLTVYEGLVITGCGDGIARAFDAKSGALKRCFEGHKFNINTIKVCVGKLFTGACDSSMRVWSLAGLVDQRREVGQFKLLSQQELIAETAKRLRDDQISLNFRNADGSQQVVMDGKRRIVMLENPLPYQNRQ